MSGSWLNVAASISMPVESSRPVFGHLTITKMARSVTMGASRLKAFHKSFTRYRIGRNVTWELVVALSTIQRNRNNQEHSQSVCGDYRQKHSRI
jgi:hypothetical protein